MKSIKLVAAAIAVSASTSSFADPMIIQQWSFINEAGFVDFTPTAMPASAVNTPTLSGSSADGGESILSTGALPDSLCWGDPANGMNAQSCLGINSQVSNNTTQTWNANGVLENINEDGSAQGNVETVEIDGDYSGALRQGTALRHDNYPITGQFLDSVIIKDGIRLEATMPEGVKVDAPELTFLVDFYETPNVGLDADGTCPFGPVSRTPDSINEKGCSDLFEIIGFDGGDEEGLNILGFGADYIDFSVKFKVSGVDASLYHRDYELITRLSGLNVAFDGMGFATRENGVNILNAQFAVRAIDAPEPSTLAIFAASLLSLAGFSRRKSK